METILKEGKQGLRFKQIADENGNKVLGAQQAANPDTTGATLANVEIEVNELKAALRAHGIIAT